MARRYQHLTDDALTAKITLFTDKIDEAVLGGDVAVIQEGGRRMELTKGNTGDAERILGLLCDERDLRANGGVPPGRAISMRFHRA